MNDDRTLHIRGANGPLQLMQLLAEDYMAHHPDKGAVLVSAGGSYRGYKAVIDGTAHLGVVTSEMHRSLVRAAGEQRVTLAPVRNFGLTAVVVITHPDNPVPDLHVDQLRDIFSGRVRNWQGVGGAAMPIDVCVLPPLASESDHWRAKVLGEFAEFRADAQVLAAAKLIEAVGSNRKAIGFVALEKLTEQRLHLVRINGIDAKPAHVLKRLYPVVQHVGVVHRTEPSRLVQSFLDHLLNSATLQRFEGKTRLLLAADGGAA